MNNKIALVGNPNCGKTTFFNKVTGASEYAGNRVGVTVKENLRKVKDKDILLCDLPGIYSLSGYSIDEKIALDFLTQNKPHGIINIADGTNLRRSLYLTIQLLKLNIPTAIAINFKDECDKNKISIDIKGLSKELGINVYFISSKTGEGIKALLEGMHKIKRADIFSFDKLNKKIKSYEDKCELKDNEIVRANSIYLYADELYERYVTKENKVSFTYLADKILLNKYIAYPFMFFVIFTVFYLTFGPFGQLIQTVFKLIFNMAIQPIVYLFWNTGEIIKSLIAEGVLRGIESVVSYLSHLIILFILISVLEDSGYMARISYITDKFMRKFGISGKSVIPMFLGLGCSTPALMSARVIKNEEERNKTLLITPFIPCSAKIPVFTMFAGLFFKDKYIYAMIAVYLISIISVILIAFILKGKNKKEELFLLELPPYRVPSVKTILKMTKERIFEFLIRAGTVILAVSVIIWFFSNFNFKLEKTANELSMLSTLGKFIAPIFSPLGFGRYEATVSLISGIAAKESIAASLSILAGGTENIAGIFTPASAMAYMCFVLLYFPCMSSFVTLVKEASSKKWILLSVLFHTFFAYGISYIVYRCVI